MPTYLDIGCGNKPKSGYTGIDINPIYYPDILQDVNRGIFFNGRVIDAIWMDNSLEHLKEPIFVLKECRRVLKDNGILEIIIPNCQWWPLLILGWFTDIHQFWNGHMLRKKNRGIHFSMWTPYTLRLTLIQWGFRILEEKGNHLSKEYYVKAQSIPH